jgi:hypothetical protein
MPFAFGSQLTTFRKKKLKGQRVAMRIPAIVMMHRTLSQFACDRKSDLFITGDANCVREKIITRQEKRELFGQ